MKIVCDSCSTKYSISDDKVRGKVFKIRCKKCSHIIVVRGTGDAPPPAEVASDAVWHLVVDGDQVGPLTDVEVRARLARGEISSENYVWKEGFADWLRLVEVPEFSDVTMGAPLGSELFPESAPAGALAPGSNSGLHDVVDEQGAFFGAGPAGKEARASTRSSSGRTRAAAAVAPEEDAFSLPVGTPARGNDSGDLFGMAPISAPADSGRARVRGVNGTAGGAGMPRHDGGRVENLTAQRSENSVLFSLSNLQSLATPAAVKSSTGPNTEGSGLIDIRAMAASTLKAPSAYSGPMLFGGDARAAADELPTYGAFSSAAPVLFPIPSSSGPPKWLYALIGLLAVVVVVVVVAAFSILRKPIVEEQVAPVAAVPAPAPAAAPQAAPPAAAKTTLAEGDLPPRERDKQEAAGEKSGDESGHDKAGKTGGHHGKGARKGFGTTGKGAAGDARGSGDSAGAAAVPATPAEPDKPKPQKGSLDDLLEGALSNRNRRARASDDDGKRAGGSTDSGGGGGGQLAKGAVVAGMAGVKGKVSACYSQFKVPGMAMVNVVISKSGRVSSATVTGKFAGTPTGTCVEAAVKSASFPPSDGLTTPYPFNLR